MSIVKAGKLQTGLSGTPAENMVLDGSTEPGRLALYDGEGTLIGYLDEGMIETVTNANGTATKYPDGTMICKFESPDQFLTDTAAQALYFASVGPFTFPVPFVGDTPNIIVNTINAGGGPSWAAFTGTGLSEFSAIMYSAGTSYTGYVTYTAIGRWK